MYSISITFLIFLSSILPLSNCSSSQKVDNLFGELYTKEIYSGYLSTDIEQNELFFIFIPSQSNTSLTDPVLLWLNGGPFCSSLFGLLGEIGPVIAGFFTGYFEKNEYSWNKKINLLVFEFPAGVGFSKSYDKKQKWNDIKTANSNLHALKEFFKMFPQYEKNPFYMSGESYAGVYIPFLSKAIIDDGKKINLKGILIGNGIGDFSVDAEYSMFDFCFNHGLIPIEDYENYIRNCHDINDFELNKNYDKKKCEKIENKMLDYFNGIDIYGIYRKCYLNNSNFINDYYYENYYNSYKRNIYKLLKRNNNKNDNNEENELILCRDDYTMDNFLNNDTIKNKLNATIEGKWTQCANELYNTYNLTDSFSFYKDYYPLHSDLQIWFFSGVNDAVVSTLGTLRWIEKLKWNVTTEWRQWKNQDNQIAGHVQQYENGFTLLTFKNAGHMVPQDMRKESYLMLEYFLNNKLPE